MHYQLLKFSFKHMNHSRGEVLQTPNWFERFFLNRKSKVTAYIGWLDYWVNEVTHAPAPYHVRSLLTTQWHEKDLQLFKARAQWNFETVVNKWLKDFLRKTNDPR